MMNYTSIYDETNRWFDISIQFIQNTTMHLFMYIEHAVFSRSVKYGEGQGVHYTMK